MQDRLLVFKISLGDERAFGKIYQKYRDDLYALAVSLCNDREMAEDAVHDVFVSFVRSAGVLQIRRSLKSYLLVSVANRVRDSILKRRECSGQEDTLKQYLSAESGPADKLAVSERSELVDQAMGKLPYEQKEVIVMHLYGGMKFRVIADSLGISVNTVQSRYRYGLEKLKTFLNGEVDR